MKINYISENYFKDVTQKPRARTKEDVMRDVAKVAIMAQNVKKIEDFIDKIPKPTTFSEYVLEQVENILGDIPMIKHCLSNECKMTVDDIKDDYPSIQIDINLVKNATMIGATIPSNEVTENSTDRRNIDIAYAKPGQPADLAYYVYPVSFSGYNPGRMKCYLSPNKDKICVDLLYMPEWYDGGIGKIRHEELYSMMITDHLKFKAGIIPNDVLSDEYIKEAKDYLLHKLPVDFSHNAYPNKVKSEFILNMKYFADKYNFNEEDLFGTKDISFFYDLTCSTKEAKAKLKEEAKLIEKEIARILGIPFELHIMLYNYPIDMQAANQENCINIARPYTPEHKNTSNTYIHII